MTPLISQALQDEFEPEKESVEELKAAVEALVAARPDSKTSLLIKDKMNKVSGLSADVQNGYDDRLQALEKALEAGQIFWSGLDELKHILKDVQDHIDNEEPPAADLDDVAEQRAESQV